MKKILLGLSLCLVAITAFADVVDPLPSWNDGPIKRSLIKFVSTVTDKANENFVAEDARIATFDNDGTLWVEKPVYTQAIYTYDRILRLAPRYPEWKTLPPFSYILSGNKKALENLSVKDLEKLLAATHTGMTVEDFNANVKNWLATAKDKHFDRLYTQDIYQPMLEAMQYLRDNHFKVYIVTGGGQDFVRAFSQDVYGVPIENVIGTASKTKYTYKNSKPILIKTPELLLLNDKTGKPEDINLFIGRKPIIAFGNSDGDRQMLEWTQSREGAHMMLLVHHDDAEREYAYGAESKVGTFSNALMSEANHQGWKVISMKKDWKVVFPD